MVGDETFKLRLEGNSVTSASLAKVAPIYVGMDFLRSTTIRGRRNHWRSCLLQLFKLGLNPCPGLGVSLRRVRSIRMPIEFQKLGPNLERSTTESLLR